MASIKQRKNTWYAVWYNNGKAVCKSTNIKVKGDKEKKLAQNTADTMEQAAKGNITMHEAMDALRKVSTTLGMKNKLPTVREYLESYKPTGSESHCNNIKRAVRLFLDYIGSESYQPLDMLAVPSCRSFMETQLQRVSYGTAANYKAYLQNIFQLAYEDELIPRNPFSLVNLKRIKPNNEIKSVKRLPFTIEEIQEIIKKCVYPWKEIVTLCILTGGQRLGDIVTMRWNQVLWDKGYIHIKTMKTGKVIATPITKPIESLLRPLYSQHEEYIFPDMATRYNRSKGAPSSEFSNILRVLGIVKQENIHQGAANRNLSDKTFHSLRHSVVSMLRVNTNFSTDIIRETVGHDSEEVERNYFTASVDSKRSLIDYLAQQVAPAESIGEG